MSQTERGRAFPAWGAALGLAFVTFLPFLRGTLSGGAFYFRDLSRQFFPLRLFALEGLMRGEVRYWNPLLHEGIPLSLPALSYLPDLLQLLKPTPAGISLLLSLHVPLGAVFLFALARGLGLSRLGAATGGLVYALGGFYLSCLNLYVYLEAAAWAPFVILAILRAADGRPKWQGAAAVAVAIAISTTGIEIVAQAILIGMAMGVSSRELLPRMRRILVSLGLGAGLAAPTIFLVKNLAADSARGRGFPTAVVLAHSVHPLTLPQMVVGGWLGNLSDLANGWWGSNFFPLGFPYVLSAYVGAAALSLAIVGACSGGPLGRRLAIVCVVAIVGSFGRWAGLAPLVDALPPLHAFRYPSKVLYSAHLSLALLAAQGVFRLEGVDARRAWRSLAWAGLSFAVPLLGLPVLFGPLASWRPVSWFLKGFLPPIYVEADRLRIAERIGQDALQGGLVTLCVGLLALAVVSRRARAELCVTAIVALVAVDLLRTGAGLNPMVTSSFYSLSPEMTALTASLKREGGRVFSCEPESSPAYFIARRAHPESHEVWTFATFMETLLPAYNMPSDVPTALSRDLTMFVPEWRVLGPDEMAPSSIPAILDRLRRAGVAHVLSLEPISDRALRERTVLSPLRIAPLSIYAYDLEDPLPLRLVAEAREASGEEASSEGMRTGPPAGTVLELRERPDQIEMDVEASRPGLAVVRDAYAPGWVARVNGVAVPILKADGRHRAVRVESGRSRVVFLYRPPGLAVGLFVLASAALLTLLVSRGAGGRP